MHLNLIIKNKKYMLKKLEENILTIWIIQENLSIVRGKYVTVK